MRTWCMSTCGPTWSALRATRAPRRRASGGPFTRKTALCTGGGGQRQRCRRWTRGSAGWGSALPVALGRMAPPAWRPRLRLPTMQARAPPPPPPRRPRAAAPWSRAPPPLPRQCAKRSASFSASSLASTRPSTCTLRPTTSSPTGGRPTSACTRRASPPPPTASTTSTLRSRSCCGRWPRRRPPSRPASPTTRLAMRALTG
ncbi:hypothetical protein BU14_0488s0009 [Porphyra umbilicalis]|uniref:Uncharacterized protein n=1 Tax=Porphyra umbilicalis TaxID=2786 RepID=A0A1X6NTQ0_PORUM|nr:hypothetical protein BU14_0488s0009 [Porphyra umbilicalis]|eukprot:OSX71947.1 hypothetical protein BU14_0488s0009 [Porphyra umbilicalis]